MADARFEDGGEAPLHLMARAAEDMAVLSALMQDAVLPVEEMRWDRRARRFALLINRFRWEDSDFAEVSGRPYERVRSLVTIQDVLSVRSQGLDPREGDQVLEILSLGWRPGDDGTGHLLLTLAGDGAVEIAVETLEIHLTDVTRPYVAPSRKKPDHGA